MKVGCMTLKVPFKAVPNSKIKTSWLAVSVCFGFASSLLTIALPQAFAESNVEDESRTIERGNIAVTKSIQSNPLGGTTIVYAKTRLNDFQSAPADTQPKVTDKVMQKAAMVDDKPAKLDFTAVESIANAWQQNSDAKPTKIKDTETDTNGASVKTEVMSSPMAGSTTVYSKTKVSDKQESDTFEIKQTSKKLDATDFQPDIDFKPIQKGMKIVAEQTEAEKAMIEKFRAKNKLAKRNQVERFSMNQQSSPIEESALGLTPTEKVMPIPKPMRQINGKPKTNKY